MTKEDLRDALRRWPRTVTYRGRRMRPGAPYITSDGYLMCSLGGHSALVGRIDDWTIDDFWRTNQGMDLSSFTGGK